MRALGELDEVICREIRALNAEIVSGMKADDAICAPIASARWRVKHMTKHEPPVFVEQMSKEYARRTPKTGMNSSDAPQRTFATGAIRDSAAKKPMIHLISPFFLQDLGEWLRFACTDRKPEPYDPRNWEKGMPFSETLGSGVRHIVAIMAGDESEDHIAAFGFAAMALAHYRHEIGAGRLPASLDDMPKYEARALFERALEEQSDDGRDQS